MIERTMMQGLVSWMRLGSKFCNSAHIVGEKVYNWLMSLACSSIPIIYVSSSRAKGYRVARKSRNGL